MNNLIGVMQGRLLPKYLGRYQAFPIGYWQEEFALAASIGLNCIEFILDYNDAAQNPLLRDGGVDEIESIVEETGVVVKTICADYFMEAPLHHKEQTVSLQSLQVLRKLLVVSKQLGVTDIVIPCVDKSSLSGCNDVQSFIEKIRSVLDDAEQLGINLSFETDLGPQAFRDLLDSFDSNRIAVNYDIGNSAALGYDLREEWAAYGDRITDIHIKDRKFNGGSVLLGEGDADFSAFFERLHTIDFGGPLIFQAYRDDEGRRIFKKQLGWFMNLWEQSS